MNNRRLTNVVHEASVNRHDGRGRTQQQFLDHGVQELLLSSWSSRMSGHGASCAFTVKIYFLLFYFCDVMIKIIVIYFYLTFIIVMQFLSNMQVHPGTGGHELATVYTEVSGFHLK